MRAWLPTVVALPFALTACPALLSDWNLASSGSGVDAASADAPTPDAAGRDSSSSGGADSGPAPEEGGVTLDAQVDASSATDAQVDGTLADGDADAGSVTCYTTVTSSLSETNPFNLAINVTYSMVGGGGGFGNSGTQYGGGGGGGSSAILAGSALVNYAAGGDGGGNTGQAKPGSDRLRVVQPRPGTESCRLCWRGRWCRRRLRRRRRKRLLWRGRRHVKLQPWHRRNNDRAAPRVTTPRRAAAA